ncbi:Uncharacterised protein [Sphingobacterium multivorum]|jgi:hypothetical protein|nr:Uncharacterised protein [Sphingobacterium multivorum]
MKQQLQEASCLNKIEVKQFPRTYFQKTIHPLDSYAR